MKLPFLDQTIELDRGEAHELQHVVGNVCLGVIQSLQAERPAPLPAGLMLAFPILRRLVPRFGRIAQAELFRMGLPKSKAAKFRLSYEEMAALMLYVVPVATSARVPLGKVQQKSLNLDLFIAF